jgi:hypothetical protein
LTGKEQRREVSELCGHSCAAESIAASVIAEKNLVKGSKGTADLVFYGASAVSWWAGDNTRGGRDRWHNSGGCSNRWDDTSGIDWWDNASGIDRWDDISGLDWRDLN